MKRQVASGVLIVEAIVASFLMVFAFMASASLYEAALRWESQGANMRKAGMVAERKMEELRAIASNVPAGDNFADHIDAILAAPHPEIDGFPITVTVLPNHHEQVLTSGYTPPDGFFSPCSTLYTAPDNPGSTSRATPPYNFDSGTPLYPAPDGAGDFQLNNLYETYPYARTMNRSYRLVKVEVDYGARNGEPVELISVLGDPLMPLDPGAPDPDIDGSLSVSPAGNNTISSGASADYSIVLQAANGVTIEDVACLWSIHPLTGGSADLFTLDAMGRSVRVSHGPNTGSGMNFRLYPKIRYRGEDIRANSGDISIP